MVRPIRNILKQGQRVVVAASADDSRRPNSGPDFDGGEDPGWLLLALGDRSDFVSLKLRGPKPGCFFIVEAPAAIAGFFQPSIDGIPADALDTAIADLFRPSTLRVAT